MRKAELVTIKVLKSSVSKLNEIGKRKNEKQYEVVERLSNNELEHLKKQKRLW